MQFICWNFLEHFDPCENRKRKNRKRKSQTDIGSFVTKTPRTGSGKDHCNNKSKYWRSPLYCTCYTGKPITGRVRDTEVPCCCKYQVHLNTQHCYMKRNMYIEKLVRHAWYMYPCIEKGNISHVSTNTGRHFGEWHIKPMQ